MERSKLEQQKIDFAEWCMARCKPGTASCQWRGNGIDWLALKKKCCKLDKNGEEIKEKIKKGKSSKELSRKGKSKTKKIAVHAKKPAGKGVKHGTTKTTKTK